MKTTLKNKSLFFGLIAIEIMLGIALLSYGAYTNASYQAGMVRQEEVAEAYRVMQDDFDTATALSMKKLQLSQDSGALELDTTNTTAENN